MTTAVIQTISGSAIGAVFARVFLEVEAFFEEASVAIARAHKEQPFGL